MSFKKRAAHVATTAGLALAMTLGGAGVALAATTQVGDTGSITITDAVNGTYYAYKLFDGTFEDFDSEDGTETITKMGDAVLNSEYKDVILDALKQAGHEVDTTDLSDRALADAILDEFVEIEEEGTMRIFANLLAYLLEEAGVEPTMTSTSTDGLLEFEDLNCGYWLVKQDSTTPTDEDGEEVTDYAMTTALLFAVDGDEEADAKVTTPVLEKFVVDDDATVYYYDEDGNYIYELLGEFDEEYQKVADSGAITEYEVDENGEIVSATAEMCSISYEFVSTVSGNIADFNTYYYGYTDQLPEVISFGTSVTEKTTSDRLTNDSSAADYDVWSVTVNVDSGSYDVTEAFTATFTADDTGLTTVYWECEDLISVFEGLGIDSGEWAGAEFVLWYNFPLTEEETTTYLSEVSSLSYLYAETNYVYLTYSNNPYPNNPITQDEGTTTETPEDLNRVYSYNLQISKVDEDGNALAGATFELTREVVNEDGTTSTVMAGYLIVDDGGNLVSSSSANYYDGTFIFTGLEADVEYTLTETRVPSGYKSIDPIVFTITANVADDGYSIESISVDPEATTDPSGATVLTTSDATVYLTVTNVEGYDLPLTGMAGIAAGVVVGAAIIAVSVTVIARRKKNEALEA